MKKKLFLFSSFIILLIVSNTSNAQDSSKIIILSKYVGTILDSVERSEYNSLPIFGENFVSAFFYHAPDSQYYGKIKLKSGNLVKDTTINISYNSILNLVARIQQQEKLKYGIDDTKLELYFTDGSEVEDFVKKPNPIVTTNKMSPPSLRKVPTQKLAIDYSEMIGNDLKLGISAGLIYNSADFKDLSRVFNLLEENIPDEGFEIPLSKLSFKTSLLYRFSTLIIFNKKIFGEIVYSFAPSSSKNSAIEYQSFSASIGYLFNLLENLSPYVSIGYSGATFTTTNYYGYSVNDRRGTLESIKIEGNVKGFLTSAGFLFNVTQNFGFNLFTSYKFYSNASVKANYYSYDQNAPLVDANGIELGVSIYITN